MSELNEHDHSSAAPTPAVTTLRAGLVSRRRFARAAAAVPVVLTMASLPVHAAPLCINPSGFISQTTFASRHPGGTVCTSQGPAYWAAAADSVWPGVGELTKKMKFKNVFGGASDLKLIEVVSFTTTSSADIFSRYCVAAFLNASEGNISNFRLTVRQSKGLWTAIMGGTAPVGSDNPIPVTTPAWDVDRAVAWLKTAMP